MKSGWRSGELFMLAKKIRSKTSKVFRRIAVIACAVDMVRVELLSCHALVTGLSVKGEV